MRYQISKEEISTILELYDIDVRMWHVLDDGTFAGAICDGSKPEILAQQKNSADDVLQCPFCGSEHFGCDCPAGSIGGRR